MARIYAGYTYADRRDGCVTVRDHLAAIAADGRAIEVAVFGQYHGGAYIELFDGDSDAWIANGYGPFDCINVWDYEAGRPRIPHTVAGVRRAVRAWLRAAAIAELEEVNGAR